MKAIVYSNYGPPESLRFKEVRKPDPKGDEVLVKIHAATVNRTDCATIRAIPFFTRVITGLFRPKKQIPGTEFSGEIEAIGKDVSPFKIGDRVFGFNDEGAQSHAEFTVVTEGKMVLIPEGITFEQAAASTEGAHYAYNFIDKVDIARGQQILVNGATGAIGSAAVQLLKHFEVEVTAVCATENIDLVRSLGADRVIDYIREEFTKDDQKFDFVFDTVGKSSFFQCRHLLKPGGVYISSDLGYMWQNLYLPLVTAVVNPVIGNRKTIFPTPRDISATLLLVQKLMAQKQFRPVIDSKYPLEKIVEAYKYVEKGHKKGNVVITIHHNRSP
ncbi:MAG: NAD(P)-dependent alcohol dehydrogenase [bacterium]